MSPDAPPPTYDSHGNEVAPWHISLAYNPVRDLLTLWFRQEACEYASEKTLAMDYPPTSVEQALEVAARLAREASARRLF